MKKIIALVLTAVMLVALAVSASAIQDHADGKTTNFWRDDKTNVAHSFVESYLARILPSLHHEYLAPLHFLHLLLLGDVAQPILHQDPCFHAPTFSLSSCSSLPSSFFLFLVVLIVGLSILSLRFVDINSNLSTFIPFFFSKV